MKQRTLQAAQDAAAARSDDLDYSILNPGIRETVRLLRRSGWNTCDSGDGTTHEHGCDLPVPYIHIRLDDPHSLISAANEVLALLEAQGMVWREPDQRNPDDFGCRVEASYVPGQSAIVSVFGVDDAALKLSAQEGQ